MSGLAPSRVQDFLREQARRQFASTRTPPFTCFFHPEDDLAFLNYAIPDPPPRGRLVPVAGTHDPSDLPAAIEALCIAFDEHKRRPRVEFIAECFPALAAALDQEGFRAETTQPLLTCTPATWRPPPADVGVRVEPVLPSTPWPVVRDYLQVQREAFDIHDAPPLPEQVRADHFPTLGIAAGLVAYAGAVPVGSGGFTEPAVGLTEMIGLAVHPDHRGRGVATFLASALARAAHETGVEAVILTPGDGTLRDEFEKAGFRATATLVAYRA